MNVRIRFENFGTEEEDTFKLYFLNPITFLKKDNKLVSGSGETTRFL